MILSGADLQQNLSWESKRDMDHLLGINGSKIPALLEEVIEALAT